jgi:hypothetical protein
MAQLPQKNTSMSGAVGAALAAWLGVQVLALGLGAGRAMLWARSPGAGEQLSLFIMLAVQIGAAALLFPLLLANWRVALIALVTAWPFAELARFLADASRDQWMMGELYVSVWLVSLYLWAKALRNSWGSMLGAAVTGMLSLGGPVLWYLRSEFGNGGRVDFEGLAMFGPVMGAFSLIIPGSRIAGWVLLSVFLLTGATGCAARCVYDGRCGDKLST